MIKRVSIFTAIVVGVVGITQSVYADDLLIRYNGGEKQIIELKQNIKDVVEIKFVKRSKNGKEQKNIKNSEKSKKESAKEQGKSSGKKDTVNLGNGIKGYWETPNPYLPPDNE